MEPMVITPMPMNTIRIIQIDLDRSISIHWFLSLPVVSRFYFPFLDLENWMLKWLIIWFFSFKFRVTNVNYLGRNAISNFVSDNIVTNYWYFNLSDEKKVQPFIIVLRNAKHCLATQSIIINKIRRTNEFWNRIRFVLTDSNWRSWSNNRRD